jgi:hypothetical protein
MEIYTDNATTGLVPIGYRGALLSSLLQVNVYSYVTHNLLNVLVQIANKMGLKKYIYIQTHRPMGAIYEVRGSGYLRCHDKLPSFYRLDPQSKLNGRIYEHRAWWSHKPNSISFNKEIRLKSD